ncbi:MAG: hypothetical protein IPH74_14390 [Bacteroidetes bacterium]|nr:hypothetical protein [Bacteroidota bacterium]
MFPIDVFPAMMRVFQWLGGIRYLKAIRRITQIGEFIKNLSVAIHKKDRKTCFEN